MSDYNKFIKFNKFNKGNKRKEDIGRNANFVVLVIYEKLDFCWLVRGSLFIELGCTRDLGKGWRGDLGTFMISRSI